jgi:Reverse transcriptase (RNA-dependent DNA polymerase)/gag-polypeptide of LTR copia-type/GAG-pre-integrase domain
MTTSASPSSSSSSPPISSTIIPILSTSPSLASLNQPISIKLDDTNFLSWQSQVVPALHGHGLYQFIQNPNPHSPALTDSSGALTLNPAYEAWHRQDQLLLSWLRASLSDSLVAQVVGCTTSAELWSTLHETFAISSPAKIEQLYKDLQSISKGGSSCKEYIRRIKSIVDELSFLGAPPSDAETIRYTLSGLGSDFNPLRVALSTRIEPLRLKDLHALLLTNEPLLNTSPPASFLPNSSQPTVFYSHPNPYPSQSRYPTQHSSPRRPAGFRPTFNPTRSPGSRPTFTGPRLSFFQTPTRFPTQTRATLPPLLPTPINTTQTTSFPLPQPTSYNPSQPSILPHPTQPTLPPTQPISKSNFSTETTTLPDTPFCQICEKRGHAARNCWHRYDTRYVDPPFQAYVAQPAPSAPHEWCIDSGATHHVTHDLNNLTSYMVYEGVDTLQIGSGEGMTISHIGSTSILFPAFSIHLYDVLYVPTFTRNLLSLSKLLLDNSLLIEFSSHTCLIKDRQTKQLLLQAPLINGLYLISLPFSSPQAYLGSCISADRWHARLGHPSSSTTLHLVKTFNLPCSKKKMSLCDDCCIAKSHRLPFNDSTSFSTSPLELVHSDLWGPSPILSDNGFRYYVNFIDDFSGFTWIYFLRSKDELVHVFQLFKSQVENTLQHKIKTLRIDGGTEYKPLQRLFPQINYQITCPYTPQQNGTAERKHRHIVELSLATMAHASIPLTFWDEIFASIVYLINRLPSSSHHVIPFQTLFKKIPDYSHLRILGCLCFSYTRPYNSHKLEPRSMPCVFIGYAHPTKGYKCLHLPTNKVFVSRHVIFHEQRFPFQELQPAQQHTAPTSPQVPLWIATASSARQSNNSTVEDPVSARTLHSPAQPNRSSPDPKLTSIPAQDSSPCVSSARNSPSQPSTCPQPSYYSPTPAPPNSTTQSIHPMVTRSRDNTRIPKQYSDFQIYHTSSSPESEPTSFRQAHSHPKWREAMAREIDALAKNQTWSLVSPPDNTNVVGCKWVYKIKRHADGSLERYKAHLVAKGFSQEEGVDFFDTYSPVVRPTTIRLVLSLAISLGWELQQLDVQNAFLHGQLDETVYMTQPPGFVDPNHPHHVCKLSKALYGLKQSPRAWFRTLSTALVALGFHASTYDPSLFVFHSHNITITLLVYVDDIIITGNNSSSLHNLISLLQKQFALKTLGSLTFFLGIEVLHTPSGLHLSQTKYIKDLLLRANMHNSKPCYSPMDSHLTLSKFDTPLMDNPSLYRMIVGALQYVTITRPDITFAVNKVSQFMHSPSLTHWTAVKRILRYLNGSITHGIQLTKTDSFQLHAYSDADWAGCVDDRHSTSGFAIFLGPNLLSWSSKKQVTVSRSSTEAEYRALALAAAELIWLQYLLTELHIDIFLPPILWCDNIGATFLASNPMFHARTKHVEIDYHFIRERAQANQLIIRFICSKDQTADVLTKPLPSPRFLQLRDKLTVALPPSA